MLVGAISGAVAVAAHGLGGAMLPGSSAIVLLVLGSAALGAASSSPAELQRRLPVVALYLLAHICFRLRNVHSLNRPRLVVAVLLALLVPVAHTLPALAALGLLAALLVGLIAFEATRYAEARAALRHDTAY